MPIEPVAPRLQRIIDLGREVEWLPADLVETIRRWATVVAGGKPGLVPGRWLPVIQRHRAESAGEL
jgi:hypothetical protein